MVFFYRFIPLAVGEISIRDTVRESQDNPDDTKDAQITFVSALTSYAVGLAASGGIDYGWSSLENAFKNGTFFKVRRK